MVQGDQHLVPYYLISTLSVGRLLRKGCHKFLAFAHDAEAKEVKLKDTLVISEFWMYSQKN